VEKCFSISVEAEICDFLKQITKKENNEESQQGASRHDFSAQRACLVLLITNNDEAQ
jgi:hypothetical protein